MDLRNARVLVTGGSSGIGFETAKLLKARGAGVAICGRDRKKLEQAASEIDVFPIVADVGKESEAVRMVSEVIEEMDDYNVLINNAGFGTFSPLLDLRMEEMLDVLATNVMGATIVARESARHFVSRSYGNIVNIASTAAQRGFAGGSSYVASKFALTGLTECWRAELRKHNIRVMQVNPSEVLTSFYATSGRQQKGSERKLRPVEIAQTICSMLELDDRGFITEATVWATNPD